MTVCASNYVDGSGYEAASMGARLRQWAASYTGINSIAYYGLALIQSRSRDLERNNPTVWGAVDSFKSKMVGSGITPRWQHKSKKIKEQIQGLWEKQYHTLDFDERLNFYGLQGLVASSEYISGEVFAKHIFSRSPETPYQIQLLESDFIPIDKTEHATNGNPIYMGIEISKATKKRVAYWIHENNPNDELLESIEIEPKRVPASMVMHVYGMRRPGQLRGIPNTAASMLTLHDYDQFQDAELTKIKISNLFAGVVESEAEADATQTSVMPNQAVFDHDSDSGTEPDYSLNPGTVIRPKPGEKVKFSSPPDVSGLNDWRKDVNRRISKGLNTTYENLTGDLSGVNFSSIRAGLVEHRRYIRMRQNDELIHQFCRPVGINWLRQNILAGNLPITAINATVKWTPQAFEHVKPLEDARMLIMLERAGHLSHEEVQEQLGMNYELTIDQIKSHNNNIDKNGFIFDSDPRNTTGAGIMQADDDNEDISD